jgi:glycerate 2-kinase
MMKDSIERAFKIAIASVDPYDAVDRYLQSEILSIADLHRMDVRAIAVGKGAVPMARAVVDRLGDLVNRGVVITKADAWKNSVFPTNWQTISAAHPTPDESSILAGNAIINLLDRADENTLIIACISGGASAMVVAPRDRIDPQMLTAAVARLSQENSPDRQSEIATVVTRLNQIGLITLTDIVEINNYLLGSSLDITQINTIRPLLDRLKAGGLVKLAQPARVIDFILSDVVGDPIASIASGLTWHPDAPNHLVGNNTIAARAIADFARSQGYHPQIITTMMTGDARSCGLEIARQIATMPTGTVLIYGGETTVKIPPNCNGLGGRNQELALAAAIELEQLQVPAWIATLGTDGIDGPTDAAGAIVAPDKIVMAKAIGLDPQSYLDRHDSYHFWQQLNALNIIGATGTNVADIAICIRV